ncbi:MAG: restriction endonuclease subunit S [Candidatus Cryptobacteroides sp.]
MSIGGGQIVDIQWCKLMDICKLSRGKVISKDYLRDNAGCYPVYSSQTANNGELGKINTYDYDGQYLTWTTDGAYAGTVFKRKGKFSITNVCGLITINSDVINYDFLYYWLSIEAPKYVYQGMGNPKLMSNVMGTISIPIPPLAEQERIVAILDRFEALTTDLTSGLPAEIKARQQQYEYYRDTLLSFPRKSSNS